MRGALTGSVVLGFGPVAFTPAVQGAGSDALAALRFAADGAHPDFEVISHDPDEFERVAEAAHLTAALLREARCPDAQADAAPNPVPPVDDEMYTRSDGTQDAGWMREHYDWAQSLPAEFREQAVVHLDAVWNHANTEALEENNSRAELAALLRGLPGFGPIDTPAGAASTPVPQADAGGAEPPAQAPPASRGNDGMCRCGHPIGEHDTDYDGECTGTDNHTNYGVDGVDFSCACVAFEATTS